MCVCAQSCPTLCNPAACLENPMDGGAWKAAVHGVAKGRTRLSNFTFTFRFHALEKEMATHSSVLALRIPGMGEPGGLLSMGSHRVRHNCSDLAAAANPLLGFPGGSAGKESICNMGDPGFDLWVGKIPWRREWLPTPVFCPGEFHGQKSLADYSPQGQMRKLRLKEVRKCLGSCS